MPAVFESGVSYPKVLQRVLWDTSCCQLISCHLPALHSEFNGLAGIYWASRFRVVAAHLYC